jgi:hypothetical protein
MFKLNRFEIKDKQFWVIASTLIAIKLLIHFYFNLNSGLHRDEYLYLSFHDHLSAGYMSVPPFIGLISWLISFFPDSPFWVRLFPTLAGGFSLFIISLIVKELKAGKFALILSGIAFILSAAYLRSNSLFQPVCFDILFWLLSMHLTIKLINRQDSKIWIWLFAAWGVAFLNKYSIAVLILVTILVILISQPRKLTFNKHFIIGGAIAILIISPNLIWQYQHNFPVFFHLSELHKTQLVNVSMISFLVNQLLMNIQATLLWLSGLFIILFHKNERNLRPMGLIFLLGVLFLALAHGKDYYTLGLYPALIAISACMIEKYATRKWVFAKYLLLISALTSSLPIIPFLTMPFLDYKTIEKAGQKEMIKPFLKWEDGKQHAIPQDFADMTGWPELADIVIKHYTNLPDSAKKDCAIYAENYGMAGAIKYYGRKFNLPEPVCFNDNFLFHAPDSLNIKSLIYINDEIEEISNYFEKVEKIGQVKNPYFREGNLPVWLCTAPLPNFAKLYTEKVGKLKSAFQR